MTDGVRAPLSVATKIAYGIGGVGDSIKTFGFTTFLLFYYTTVLGLSGVLLGVAVAAGLVWDAAIDPSIGYLSDRASVRFGRRHSFMLAGALCAAVGLIAVFRPPPGLSAGALFVWLMVSSLVVRSGNSLFMVPYSALGAELAGDYHERTTLSGYRAGAVLVGTLLAAIAAFTGFFASESAAGPDPKFARSGYESMGLFFGLAILGTGLAATFGTLHERGRSRSSSARQAPNVGLWSAVRSTLGRRPFRVLVLSGSLSVMAATINAALMLHFLTYYARVPSSEPIGLSFGGFYVGALTGVLVWVQVSKFAEKHHLYAGTALLSAVVISSGYWLIGDGRFFGTGNVAAVVMLTALGGFFAVGGSVLAPSMLADITARDEEATGHRRDGTFFGVHSLGQQLSSGLAVLISGGLLDRVARLVPGQVEQSASTIERLAMVACLLPAVLMVASAISILRYDRSLRGIMSARQPVISRRSSRAPLAEALGSNPDTGDA